MACEVLGNIPKRVKVMIHETSGTKRGLIINKQLILINLWSNILIKGFRIDICRDGFLFQGIVRGTGEGFGSMLITHIGFGHMLDIFQGRVVRRLVRLQDGVGSRTIEEEDIGTGIIPIFILSHVTNGVFSDIPSGHLLILGSGGNPQVHDLIFIIMTSLKVFKRLVIDIRDSHVYIYFFYNV